MGALLRALGRNDEAEAVYRDVMEKRRSLLGDHHVDVARSQCDLASALSDQGRFQEAEPLFRQALATFDQTLPADDPELAKTRESLHVVLEKLNRSAESAEIKASVHGG
jgi:tetratricopeptide (TPR) repeat protein